MSLDTCSVCHTLFEETVWQAKIAPFSDRIWGWIWEWPTLIPRQVPLLALRNNNIVHFCILYYILSMLLYLSLVEKEIF